MTLTAKTMEWLDQNRRRSYPMEREAWRMMVDPASGLDGVLLDAIVFDASADGTESLYVDSVSVSDDSTTVSMTYGSRQFSVSLSGGSASGCGSYEQVNMSSGSARMSFSFSSHAYLLDTVGKGSWKLGCRVLSTRVVTLSDGRGVDSIDVNGSNGVDKHDPGSADGEVVLEDGYRTSPVVNRGRVLVRVGKRYGLDPCKYDFGESGVTDCRRPLFFFCGQNAVNSGNVNIGGGMGVSVTQGRKYTVRDPSSKCNGMSIPCIEIVAGDELRHLCRP